MSKLKLKFKKEGYIKYISHLDLMRLFQRAIKRSNLPVKYSQGFNPHPIMSITFPLSVGTVGLGEYIVLELMDNPDVDLIIEQLNNSLPEGIKILEGCFFDGKDDFLENVYMAEYSFKIFCCENVENIKEKIENLLSNEQIIVEKMSKKKFLKEVNIAQYIFKFNIVSIIGKEINLSIYLSAGKKESIKPDLIVTALDKNIEGISVDYYSIVRERFIA